MFTQAYFRHTKVVSTTTMSGSSAASDHRLFPAAVPFPTDVLPPRRRGQTRADFLRRAARHATNILFAYFTFVELGCPKSWRPVSFPPSGAQAVGAANIESEMPSFLRHGGGIGTTALAGADPSDILSNSQLSSAALPVDPDRVALPEVAGTIDPRTALPPERRFIFEDWELQVRLPPEERPRPLSRSPHAPVDKELGFAQEMRRRRMGRFVRASELPRDPTTGEVPSAGLFTVPTRSTPTA